jgi:beta-glucanase (GH16 family)
MATKTFSDEFDSLSAWNGTSGTWQYVYSWSSNGYDCGGDWLVNPTWGPTSAANTNPYAISNGVLSVGLLPTPASVLPSVNNQPFLSGQIETQQSFSQLYGYFEISAKIPGTPGLNSAFWLLPENGAWPPELDVFEILGKEPDVFYMTSHYGANNATTQSVAKIPNPTTTFNTYAVDWERDYITWYLNGKQVAQQPTPASMNVPMYMLIDTAAGTSDSWQGKPAVGATGQMLVDWVHVYTSNPYTGEPVTPSTAVTTGTGSDTLVLGMSEDAYNGDAQFTVSVDGKQLGGTFTTTALHTAGASQSFTFKGDWAVGAHAVAVNFLNDGYGGTATTDRNLYVNSVSYNGANTGQNAVLLGAGPANFNATDSTAVPTAPVPVTTGTGSDTLVLGMSEDAYGGDAQFTVSVDGKQLGGTFTTKALHATGASQSFTFKGDWAVGAHTVAVNFLNDGYGGTPDTDCNLYVNSVSYNGANTGQNAVLWLAGPTNFSATDATAILSPATGSGNDTLAIRVSEDAYLGNAQFTVAVDGRQLGGTFTATALHATGASQTFTFKGDFGSGQHAVAVKFLNDAYGGTTATDRNLYVNGITYNGTNTAQSAALMSAGAKTFTVSGGTTPSVTETGDHGSLQKNLSQAGTYKVGGDTFVLSSGNAAAVALGTGVSQIKFIGASSVALTGGSGQAVVTANAGSNRFVAGTGSLDVTGGGGKDAYVFHANSGMLTIQDFSLAKGDTLTVDKALQGSLKQASDGQGGTMLTFGTAGHGVDIHGIAALPSTNVLWA